MTEISPLRRRMIEDMTVRNLSPATQRSYVRYRDSASGARLFLERKFPQHVRIRLDPWRRRIRRRHHPVRPATSWYGNRRTGEGAETR